MLGLISTRSISKEVPGITELVAEAAGRIKNGLGAYQALQTLKTDRTNADARAKLTASADDLGYALLLKKIRPDVENATDDQIQQAAWTTVPAVSPLFWSFRVMVGLGFFFIGLFIAAFWLATRRRLQTSRVFLWIALCSLPLPWIAAELGWYVAEVGRQPWVIEGVLPTFLAVSSLAAGNVLVTLVGFVVFYSTLLVVDIYLMTRAIKAGPPEVDDDEPTRPSPASPPPSDQEKPMLDYEILRLIWWLLLGVLLIGFAVMDGFDLGVGILLPFVAGPTPSGGSRSIPWGRCGRATRCGSSSAAARSSPPWPILYAVAFSGFYLAMFLVLCAFIVRPVGFKFRSKVADPRWRAVWDWALFAGGLVPALIFGVAFGNVLLGAPFRFDDTMRMTYEGNLFGLLTPFALLSGLVSVAMLAMQGGAYLAMKAGEPVEGRAVVAVRYAAIARAGAVLARRNLGGLRLDGLFHHQRGGCRRSVQSAAQDSHRGAGWLARQLRPASVDADRAAAGLHRRAAGGAPDRTAALLPRLRGERSGNRRRHRHRGAQPLPVPAAVLARPQRQPDGVGMRRRAS